MTYGLRTGQFPRALSAKAIGAARGVLLGTILLLGRASGGEAIASINGDGTLRAGDDFYEFVNSAWLHSAEIPPGRTSLDTSAALRAESAMRVQALLDGAANGTLVALQPSERALIRLVADYYDGEADAAAIEAAGLRGLAAEFRAIEAIHDGKSLATYLGHSVRLDDGTNLHTESLLGVWVHQGFHDPDRYSAHLVQGGLGLPDRDDYLDDAPAKAELRDRYRRHAAKLLGLANVPDSELRAERVLNLEVEIARTHAARADTDDVFKTDNTWARSDFVVKAPGLDWDAFFAAAGMNVPRSFVVWQPGAVAGAASLAANRSLADWKDYLTLHLIEHYAPVLPLAIGREHEALRSGRSAADIALDRRAQALEATNAALGEAVGRLYVDRYFPAGSKAAATAMVQNIRSAYRTRIASALWMSTETRQRALSKLGAVVIGLGYPDTWTSYSGLDVKRGDAIGNRMRVEQFEYRRAVAKLDRPVDPADWPLAPQSVSAIINFSPNSLEFAAALLQPPFFDPSGDAASNYGSAGAGISHEIWHSFDELGHLYDERGRLGDWWTPADLANYHIAIAPLRQQYASYCPQPQLCVRGEQVNVESVADLVGVVVAHDAYLLSLHGTADVVKDGLTGEQRFFRAFAQRWRRVQTDSALRQTILADTHAPGRYRAATVRNLDAWYDAFGVEPGDRLYLAPGQRVRLP